MPGRVAVVCAPAARLSPPVRSECSRLLQVRFLAAILSCSLLLAGAPIPVDGVESSFPTPGLTGAYYDPEHDGEGFLIEVLAGERALVYWFTYDSGGRQRWFAGEGRIEGARLLVDRLWAARGARFGNEFDPAEVEFVAAGHAEFIFDDCNGGQVDYSIDGVDGTQHLQRLSSIPGSPCSARVAPARNYTGSWYDPTHDGEGFVVQQLGPDSGLVYWFSFDSAGDPAWFFGLAEIDNGGLWRVADAFRPVGGRFGPDFSPADIELVPWGEFRLELACFGARVVYASEIAEFGNGEQNLEPLTRPLGVECPAVAPDIPRKRIPAGHVVAYEDVSIVPVSENGVLRRRTVVVRDGTIETIAPALEFETPADAIIIDGRGRYLMPGLVDLHTHLGAEVTVEGGIGRRQLKVYLANGVTTILNQGDFMFPLGRGIVDLKRDLAESRIPGPTLYLASYARGPRDGGTSQQVLRTAQDGRRHVETSKQAGYDFIKVYNWTPADALRGIRDQAEAEGMAIMGHIPQTVSMESAFGFGLTMVAHAASYYWTHFGFSVRPSLIQAAIEATQEHDVYVNTTLYIEETIADIWGGDLEAFEAFISQPHMRYVHPAEIEVWRRGAEGERWNPAGSHPGQLDAELRFIKDYTRDFHEAGIKLTMGTDSPTVLGAPGFSSHEEMRSLASLGLEPIEVLRIATQNGGAFINRFVPGSMRFGTVEEGARADLVLLEENPLDGIENATTRVGVMARGGWWSEARLQEMLEEIAEAYGN